jgi:hypothetical protein
MSAMPPSANRLKHARHSMLETWGRTVYRRRRWVLVIALLFAVFGGI